MLQQHYLSSLFCPQSIAVIGASDRENSPGGVIFGNLLRAGYAGRLFAVNARRGTVQGQKSWASVEEVGGRIDLAIIATPPRTIPEIMEQCVAAGVLNAIILTSGFGESGASGATLLRRVRETARAGGVRILGPDCIGIMRPEQQLNAAFTRIEARPGDIALVSQSGAMCSAVLDWAATNEVGFSSVISLGGSTDVDFGEILDYLVHDASTRHILIYFEHVGNARRFIGALRSAARVKPIILLKSGRYAAHAHDGDEATADEVFDAAVRRAGIIRVHNIDQLFHAAKALSMGFRPRGQRLAIITNGAGPGAMAADRAGDLGIPLARLGEETTAALGRFLPRGWARDGLIDIGGDATPERYRDALLAIAKDPNVDSALVLLAPHAATEPIDVATAIRDAAATITLTVCCCWMGGGQVAEARRLLEEARLTVFPTPDTVIELFDNIAQYYRSQKLLVQTPGPVRRPSPARSRSPRLLIETLLSERRKGLSVMESKSILAAFDIPISQTLVAHTMTEALFVAEQIGFPVAMKIDSPDLVHKSQAGGVRLNVPSTESVRNAYQEIIAAVGERYPDARINGVSIEPQLTRPNARELAIGAFRDPVFGPVISFGPGGLGADAWSDRALALPPLNEYLARDLIESTRVGRALNHSPHQPPIAHPQLEQALIGVAELLCELPWIRRLEINPLLVDDQGAIAVDARIEIDHALGAGSEQYGHLAIYPYPMQLIREWQINGYNVTVRPVRPEDASLEEAFVRAMSDEARRMRFMDGTRELPPTLLARFTQIDYDREMALVATILDEAGAETQIGSARYALSPDGESVEFALAVADVWQKYGLGRRLMLALIDCARQSGYRAIVGDVLADNAKMLRLMESLEFSIIPHPEDKSVKRVVRALAP